MSRSGFSHSDPQLNELAERADHLGIRVSLGDPRADEERSASPRCSRISPELLAIRTSLETEPVCFEGEPGALDVIEKMSRDLASLAQQASDYEIFTREIDEAYETLSLLYRIGGELGDFTRPGEFISDALRDLRATNGLTWITLSIAENAPGLDRLAGGRWIETDQDLHWVESQLEARKSAFDEIFGATILREPDEFLACPIRVRGEHAGMLIASGERTGDYMNRTDLTSADLQASEAVARLISAVLENHRLYKEREATFMGSLSAITATLEAKDPYTCGHSERVALMARLLSESTGMGDPDRVELAGRLHDVGKIGIPDKILCKPSKLTDEEFKMIKGHPSKGYQILREIPDLEDILPGVRHHHERWDGRGYPSGLAGEQIDVISRILALADTFDAMSSNRAYRSARTREEVLAEIKRCEGAQFDPALVDPFLALDFSGFDAMKAEHELRDLGTQRIEDAA